MNKRIRSMIDTIFCDMKMTAENLALRDELMANAQARFDDAFARGMTEEQAFAEVAASLEDVSDLLREMNAGGAQPEKKEPDPKIDVRINQTDEPFEDEAEAEDEKTAEEAAPQESIPQTDLGDALNKAFSALGSWGQSIMPQAKKFAQQMDDATGGMLSDIGRAVNKGMQDAQKAASDVLDKYQQPTADAVFTPEKAPEDLREEAKDLRAQANIKRVTGDIEDAQALDAQADALEAQADALEQAAALDLARKAAEADAAAQPCEKASAQEAPIYGADGELDEAAFTQSVEQMTRDAEELIDESAHGQRSEVRFPVAGLHRIDVKLDADDITVEPTDGDEIIVFWSAQSAENEPEVSLYNHTLTIRRKNPDLFKTFFSVFSKNGGQITVLIPRGCGADYALSTTSGDIHLTGLDVENVKISSASGSIRIEPDLSARAKKVKADTVSGSVTISTVASDIKADSVSGDVFISCDAASVKGDVVSGKLHIEGACDNWDVDVVSGSAELICTTVPTGKIKIDTISGGAKLYLPESIRGFAVKFDSMGGSLRNEFGPDRFGTCTLPIKMDTISGKMLIAPLQA